MPLALASARAAEVRALLAGHGIGAGFEIRDVRKELRQGAAAVDDIKCSAHIEVNGLAQWRPLVPALLDQPNVSAMSTSFKASQRAKIEMELMADAVKDARRKAEALATGFGKKLGSMTAVSSGQLKNLGSAVGLVTSNSYTYTDRALRNQRASRDFPMIGILTMARPVNMIFRIK